MPREHETARTPRPERGEEVRLAAVVVESEPHFGVQRAQLFADEIDQLEVRLSAHRRERDELAEHRGALCE
jgi:hypothetical protein